MSASSGERVGFVGLGTMGAPMAANIVRGGYEVCLYDADRARTAALEAEHDAVPITDPAHLRECTIVVLMLPTSAIVRSVLLDEDSNLEIPFAPGTVIVDMSSSDPTETVETGHLLAQHGLQMVDAPVSGAKERATAGTLAIMLGSDDDDAARRAVPVINTMSRSIFRTGKLGTGHAMKALNNFVAGAAFAATSEALVAGMRFGLDPQVMVDVFNDSTGQSFTTTHVLGPHVVNKKFSSGFALPLLTKDVRIAQGLQRSVHHHAPVCDSVTEALEEALSSLGDVDHTQAFDFWEQK